jgi:outer membrane protein assembly factor BamD
LASQAKKTASVLGHNFPGSEWYGDSYTLVKGKPALKQADRNNWYWPFD